jgi:hypothetical protein
MRPILAIRRRNSTIIGGHLLKDTTPHQLYKVIDQSGSFVKIKDNSDKLLIISSSCRKQHFYTKRVERTQQP